MPNTPLNKEELEELLRTVRDAGAIDDNLGKGEDWTLSDKKIDGTVEAIIADRDAAVREAFKAGVAMSGGDLEFQDAFYEQWQLNLEYSQSQPKAKEVDGDDFIIPESAGGD